MTDTRSQIQKIDKQIIRLIADRKQICEDARQSGEGDLIKELESEEIAELVEEGVEMELDDLQLERLAHLVFGMCRGEE